MQQEIVCSNMQLKYCIRAHAGSISGMCFQKSGLTVIGRILSVLIIVNMLFACNRRQVTCESAPDFKSGIAQFDTSVYKLHNISRFSFIKTLGFLTFYKGKYYTIDAEKKLLICYQFNRISQDTIDVHVVKQLSLNFKPKDISINKNGIYLLSDPEYSSLFHFPLEIMDPLFTDTLTGRVVMDGIYIFPNARLNVSDQGNVTAWFNIYNSEDSYKHFEEYDYKNMKSISRYDDEEKVEGYYPSMEYPNRLDLDTFSIVSYGYKNTIIKYNRITGEIAGEYCAKSDSFDLIPSLTQDEIADVQMPLNYLISSPRYLDMKYDRKKGLFLRIAKLQQELRVPGSRRLNKIDNSPWSVVLLNSDFERVGERFVAGGKVNYLFHFSDDEGIHFLVNEEDDQIKDAYLVKFAKLNLP